MKNIDDKIQDIVDVRSFLRLMDFQADPARTLGRYHFTDVTSDLMAKWLDRIANLQGQQGPAFALAGYRGVGKSHFLGALSAIVSQPELRSRVTDSHVLASAQRLRRRHYPIAHVRRGTRDTLFEELKEAVGPILNIDPQNIGEDINEILRLASEKAGEVPFILIIDTAYEREMRVSREDGTFLSEIAAAAATHNVFLGIALDDDISGADGINASIVKCFTIDYLDQEHLYKIVDSYIFPKNSQKLGVLHEVYESIKSSLPGFKWSEQKFKALYPLHPVILEVTPFVRFYIHHFALLGFAAEAGAKVLSRPADSLISLDEVFDNVEEQLRQIDDLKEAFAAFDKLNGDIVRKLPVVQRLHGKLILKALLLHSLDGEGKIADDIRSAMLIVDERNPDTSAKYVAEILDKFAEAMPKDINRVAESGRETRYSFKLTIKDDLNSALTEAIPNVSLEAVPKILRRAMRDRFSDCTLSDDESERLDWMDCQINWRGGLRRGRLFWRNASAAGEALKSGADLIDWEVVVNLGDRDDDGDKSDDWRVIWRSASMTEEEIETVKRFHILLTDTAIRETFNTQIRSSMHAHKLAADKIFQRCFLEDGTITIDGKDKPLSEEAYTSERLSDLFSVMLRPLFDERYPDHPKFEQTLGMNEVSLLATEFFSGGGQNSTEVQQLAELFAVPLGLAVRRGGGLVPESEEALMALPVVKMILKLVDGAKDTVVPMKTIYKGVKITCGGLVREAQHLILTALVSRQQIEFVTSKGDRISRRSLDLKIIWGDIEGIARPAGRNYSGEKLVHWVNTLSGKNFTTSTGSAENMQAIRGALRDWLSDWEKNRVLDRFNELPDEILNTKIWRLSMHTKNSFGTVADAIRSVLEDSIQLDEGLHRIADAFSDSKEEYKRRQTDIIVIENFIAGAARREEIRTYLAICESTDSEDVEKLRSALSDIIDTSFYNPSEETNQELETLWTGFRDKFAEHFAVKHDVVMRSHYLQEKVDEIQRGDQWWEFENLSAIPVMERSHWKNAREICREFRQLDCRFDIREMLQIHPFCACSFTLAKSDYWEQLPVRLAGSIDRGLMSYRETFLSHRETIVPMLQHFEATTKDDSSSAAASNLIEMLTGGAGWRALNMDELQVLHRIFEHSNASDLVIEVAPTSISIMNEDSYAPNARNVDDKSNDDPLMLN